MMKVSIIIPAYNEEKRIGRTLYAYSKYFNKLNKNKKLSYEINIIINNTKDKTEEIVKKIKKKNKNIRYLNLKEGGKGHAIIQGFKDSLKRDNDLIGFVDADLATMPEAFYDLIVNLKEADGTIASRYVKGAVVNPRPTVQRIIASRVFNFFIRSFFLLKYKDTQCGAKLFKKEAVAKVINLLTISEWAFDVDLLYNLHKLGFIINEVPTTWSDKKYSKINFGKAAPFMLLAIIRLRIINSSLSGLIRAYDKIPKFFKIHHYFR